MPTSTKLLAGLIVFCGVACVTVPPPVPRPVMDPSLWAFALESGDGYLTGSGFLRQRGGDVVTCAGSPVWLLPDAPFSRWILDNSGYTGIGDAVSGPDVGRYVRESFCDASGEFYFDSLPAGPFFAVTVVTWEVPDTNVWTDDTQGGLVYVPVEIEGDTEHRIVVTR